MKAAADSHASASSGISTAMNAALPDLTSSAPSPLPQQHQRVSVHGLHPLPLQSAASGPQPGRRWTGAHMDEGGR